MSMTLTRAARAQAQGGFSLIEVMVAVLVLSLAFLALGALAARSLSSNNSAMSRSVATIAMYTIQDAMRADQANAATGSYNHGGDPILASDCPTGTSLAAMQLNRWCVNQLGSPMLGGAVSSTQASINCNPAGVSAICTISITWDDSRNGPVPGADTSQPNNQTVTTTGML